MTVAQKIIRNLLFLVIAQVISGAFHYGALLYLARTLGPVDFGKAAFAEAVLLYFMIIANLGLDTIGTRELGRNKAKVLSKDYVGSVVTLRLCLGIISFILLILFAFFINKPLQIKYLIILYGLTLFPFVLYLEWVFLGTEQMGHSAMSLIIREVVYLGLALIFIKYPIDLLIVPCIFFIARSVSSGYLIAIVKKYYGRILPKINITSWKGFLKESIPVGFSMVMVQIIYSSDTIMLGFMRSDEEVGYYNAAYKIILFIMSFANVLNISVFPVMSDYFKSSLELLGGLISNVTKLMITLAMPLAIGGVIIARPLMNLVYGNGYEAGVPAFQILIWAAAVACCNSVYGRGLVTCNRQNKFLIVVGIQTLTVIIMNIILIPLYGMIGAAIATVAAEASGFFIYYNEFRKVVDVKITGYFLRPIISSAIMAAFLSTYMKDMNLLFLIIAGAGIYIVSLYLIKGITMEEIRLFRTAITGRNGSAMS